MFPIKQIRQSTMNRISNFVTKTFLNKTKSYYFVRNFSARDDSFKSKYPSAEEENRKEIETALNIETSLFENSSKTHKPATDPQILTKFSKKFRNSALKRNAQESRIIQATAKLNSKIFAPSIIDDKELGLSFTKLKLNDPVLNKLLTTVRSRKRRDKDRQIIIEGRRLIVEALHSGLKLQSIVFSQKEQLSLISSEILRLRKNIEIYKVPQHDLKTWSTLTTPPGLLAIFDRPDDEVKLPIENKLFPITVICDNIREPNNLGSIIRTCAAVPCQQIIVLKGCCDPWETKALRGGCGAQFRIKIRDDIEWKKILDYLPSEFLTLAAECNLEEVKNYKFSNPKHSLVRSYLNIGINSPHYVIIIGGETHGISPEAYEFVDYVGNNGGFLHIPLANGIESLNTSCALTLILFELRKQNLSHFRIENETQYRSIE